MNGNLFEDAELKSELGVFSLLEDLQGVYDKFKADAELLEANKNIIISTLKPLIMFEGESDRILFRKAFSRLHPDKIDDFVYSEPADESDDGGSIGEGARNLAGFLSEHIPKLGDIFGNKKVIAVFDNDHEGISQFNSLASKKCRAFYSKITINGIDVFKHNRYPVYAMKLIAPHFRTDFIDSNSHYCYVSTELLLQDVNIPSQHREPVPHTTPPLFSFRGKKVNFANRVREAVTDFSGFSRTIDMIIHIKDLV